jgi:hypothetical protein
MAAADEVAAEEVIEPAGMVDTAVQGLDVWGWWAVASGRMR